MSIAQNPIIRSWVKVFAWWYAIALLWWFIDAKLPMGVLVYATSRALSQSLAMVLLGVVGGIGIAMLLRISGQAAAESQLQAGTLIYGASVTLGEPPPLGAFAEPRNSDRQIGLRALSEKPWWPAMQSVAPAHAEAFLAVFTLMLRAPRLPASPHPGGHGGRTLIEHSLAVVDRMLREAGGWVYKGQFDKRGNVKVPLDNPDTPHRFALADAPLLILAAFAHDIGKLACYEPLPADEQPADGPWLVKEVLPNHDHEGAKLLRRLPAVMQLPFVDRSALLIACGYYHHPFGIPISTWVTDRMRSLTELLAHADIETGKSEGHVLISSKTDEADYDSDVPAGVAVSAPRMRSAGVLAGVDVEQEPADARRAPAHVVPRELRLFRELMRRQGAIGGKHRATRCAFRFQDRLYVIEPAMRLLAKGQAGLTDPVWAHEAFETVNGNMAPFTVALAQQLAVDGHLITQFEGDEYSPSRALFYANLSESGKAVGVLVVLADAVPGSMSQPEMDEDAVLVRPFWGKSQAKHKAGNSGGAGSGIPGGDGVADHDDVLPSVSAHEESADDDLPMLVSRAAPAAPPLAGVSDVQSPLPAMPDMPASSRIDSASQTGDSDELSEEALTVLKAFRLTVLDSDIAYQIADRDGDTYLLIEEASKSGEAFRELLSTIASAGADGRAVRGALSRARIDKGTGPLCHILRMTP